MNNKIKEYRQEMTEQVIKALEQGTAPWQRPWSGDCFPQNAISKRYYSGSNMIVLSLMGLKKDGGADPRWLTYKQATARGWNVRKGEHGTRISFWKSFIAPTEDVEGNIIMDSSGNPVVKRVFMEKLFTVFHASQVDGIPAYVPSHVNSVDVNEKAERIIADSGARIRRGGCRAFYRRNDDFIQLPPTEFFIDTAGYYATFLHELVHWTGHETRLNRKMTGFKDSPSYAREELVAELGSMFLSAETDIPQTKEHFANHAAYVDSWISLLRSDPNALFKAAAEANKAAEFLLVKERARENGTSEPDIEEGAA